MRISDWSSDVCSSDLDVNHIVCVGGDIDDVKFSAEKGLAVERGGSDAWIKFLVLETEDPNIPGSGAKTHSYVTTPSEFRSEEHTSELQSLMRISYAVFCLKKKHKQTMKKTNLTLT